MSQSNEETLRSLKLSYTIELMHFGRAAKVDFYGKDNMIRFLSHAKQMRFYVKVEGIGAFHLREGYDLILELSVSAEAVEGLANAGL